MAGPAPDEEAMMWIWLVLEEDERSKPGLWQSYGQALAWLVACALSCVVWAAILVTLMELLG